MIKCILLICECIVLQTETDQFSSYLAQIFMSLQASNNSVSPRSAPTPAASPPSAEAGSCRDHHESRQVLLPSPSLPYQDQGNVTGVRRLPMQARRCAKASQSNATACSAGSTEALLGTTSLRQFLVSLRGILRHLWYPKESLVMTSKTQNCALPSEHRFQGEA